MNFRSALTAILLALLAAPAVAREAEWRFVATPNFRVFSQLGDRETAAWIRSYDQFIAATAGALGIKATSLPPLTVVLFARDKDFVPYKLTLADGRAANVAGQFSRLPSWSVIGLSAGGNMEATRRIIYHEGVHWLMSADPGRQPAWFSEGIAEMLSTFEQRGEKMNWAKPINGHLGLLYQTTLIPLQEFLTRPTALYERDSHTGRFYAQSWAFVHFLMLSKDSSRRQLLSRFLQAFRTSSGEAAVRTVFGDGLAVIEQEFRSYLQQDKFGYISLAATRVADPPPAVSATPGAVEAALGLLALGAGHEQMALEHAKRAVDLAPGEPGGHEILTYLAQRADDSAAIERHAEAALRAGSRDSDMYMLLAQALVMSTKSDHADTDARRAGLYEQAINLKPTRLDAYQRLAEVMLDHEKPREEDRRFLETGLRFFPGEDWLKVGIAATTDRLGDRAAALQLLGEALRADSTLDERQHDFVVAFRRRLVVEAMNEEIERAISSRNFATARAVLARNRAQLGDDAEFNRYAADVDQQLEFQDLLDRLRTAQEKRRPAEMRQLIEHALAHPSMTAEIRRSLESLRRSTR